MQARRIRVVCVAVAGFWLSAAQVQVPAARPAAQQLLPPVTYVCPMAEHATVAEEHPGQCPICRMTLEAVRLDLAWSCPLHPAVITDKSGQCPIDRRDLVQVTIARYWTCPDAPKEHLTDAGLCADGTPRTAVAEHRAHGNHNPRHGGLFFMAGDKWHHLEGVHPSAGLFRLHLYDNFTEPIPVEDVTGRLVLREERDPASGVWREVEVVPLKRARDGRTMEARLKKRALPLTVTAKLKFDKTSAEERFDFTFTEHSKEPPVSPPAAAATSPSKPAASATPAAAAAPSIPAAAAAPSTPAPTPAQPLPAAQPEPAAQAAPIPADQGGVKVGMTNNAARFQSFLTDQLAADLPKTAPALLDLLQEHAQELGGMIAQGQFASVYVPAMLSKEIALSLEGHTSQLPNRRRAEAMEAIRRVVLAAWQLDGYGDLGDARKLADAYRVFTDAVAALHAAYGAS